jgi:cation transport ATPase
MISFPTCVQARQTARHESCRTNGLTVRDHGKRPVNMDQIATVALVFLVGVTLSGIAGSLIELAAGAKLSFAAPFFDRANRMVFVLAVVTAGPFMLCNDAMETWRAGRIDIATLIGCALTAAIWIIANGVAVCASAMRLSLGS